MRWPERKNLAHHFTAEQVKQFISDGFVRVEAAFSRDLAAEGRAVLWEQMGKDSADPTTWAEPVVRLLPTRRAPFRAAINTPGLHAAFDQLVGSGRWHQRLDCGNSVPASSRRAPR